MQVNVNCRACGGGIWALDCVLPKGGHACAECHPPTAGQHPRLALSCGKQFLFLHMLFLISQAAHVRCLTAVLILFGWCTNLWPGHFGSDGNETHTCLTIAVEATKASKLQRLFKRGFAVRCAV